MLTNPSTVSFVIAALLRSRFNSLGLDKASVGADDRHETASEEKIYRHRTNSYKWVSKISKQIFSIPLSLAQTSRQSLIGSILSRFSTSSLLASSVQAEQHRVRLLVEFQALLQIHLAILSSVSRILVCYWFVWLFVRCVATFVT